jgi:hypothetical protein
MPGSKDGNSFPEVLSAMLSECLQVFQKRQFQGDFSFGHIRGSQGDISDVATLVFALFFFLTKNALQKVPYKKEHCTSPANDVVFFDCCAVNISEL